jgi:hypothetical protein
LLLESKTLNRVALTCRQTGNGCVKPSNSAVPSVGHFLRISTRIRMILVSERCIRLPPSNAALATQPVDGSPLRDSSKPSTERAVGIVCPTRAMNRKQDFLHDIVDVIGWYTLPARHRLDERSAVPQ